MSKNLRPDETSVDALRSGIVRNDVAVKRVFYGDNNSDFNVYIRELILSNKDRNLQILLTVPSMSTTGGAWMITANPMMLTDHHLMKKSAC